MNRIRNWRCRSRLSRSGSRTCTSWNSSRRSRSMNRNRNMRSRSMRKVGIIVLLASYLQVYVLGSPCIPNPSSPNTHTHAKHDSSILYACLPCVWVVWQITSTTYTALTFTELSMYTKFIAAPKAIYMDVFI